MIYWDIEQGSSEWLKLRCGRVTASMVKKVMGTKGARETYMLDLVAERLTGNATEHFVSQPMKNGMEFEPIARLAYECDKGVEVLRPGIITHDDIPWFGASPDGLIGEDGGLEIKCPNTTTHISWLEDGVIPKDHLDQVLSCLACSKLKWWDFRSFDPRLPQELQSFDVRCWAKDHKDKIETIESEVIKFIDELDARVKKLSTRRSRNA